ncbi:MAG: Gldg family protein [Pseudomonadota bacterium]
MRQVLRDFANRFTQGRLWFIAVTLLATAVFGLANPIVQSLLAPARIDFTERSLYSLSPGTVSALRGITEPIDLTFVYTRQEGQAYPAIRAHATRVRELLASYESLSRGKLRITEIDPDPFSEDEDAILAAGLPPVSTEGTDPLYFGLYARNAVDDLRTIPFLAPERESVLEYELTRLIARLDDPSLARIGVLTGLRGMEGDGQETGYAVLRDLAVRHDVVPVDPDFVSLPEDLSLLIIAHPPGDLDDFQLWLIDQFLLRRGRLIVLADPAALAASGAGLLDPVVRESRSSLPKLLDHWGVRLSETVVADVSAALPVQVEDADGRTSVAGQPLFISAPLEGMATDDPITADLRRGVNFGASGTLSVSGESGLAFSPLIQTGPAPSAINADFALRNPDPADIILAYQAGDGPEVLAARLSGRFATAFPGGAPPVPITGDPLIDDLSRAAAADLPGHIDTSAGTGAVILVADVDLLDDGFYLNPNGGPALGDNGTFILNAVDALLGDDGLLTLRSRAEALRPMSRIDALRSRAEARFFAEQSALEQRLADAETRLSAFQRAAEEAGFIAGDFEAELSPGERAEVQTLRDDILAARARLRAIERDYRKDIDALEAVLKLLNIWLMPIVVLAIGAFVYVRRRGRA